MKLKFKHQDFQVEAVDAVVDLFSGQEKKRSTFSIEDRDEQLALYENTYGYGNRLRIDGEALLRNMHAVQKRNSLPLTDGGWEKQSGRKKDGEAPAFCIEMETGTGKTYVYTRTMFELNRRYGFAKFIIVVPSVAIREGVYKSLQITAEHFGGHYDNVPNRFFIYNSARLSDVKRFAASSDMEIMIINIDAFKKAENIINQAHERLGGDTAMHYIRDTHPIVIIDEPQSVDNTPRAKEAIASLNPLCVLRYSATHREKINLLYRLTPVDAYQKGLVKQIRVSSNSVSNDFNRPYIRLLSVSGEKGFKARLEIDAKEKNGLVKRKSVTVTPSDGDLYRKSGERELYEGYVISGIDCTPGFESVEFANTETVRLGQATGDIDEDLIKQAQIRRTVETHLDKELRYLSKGIKVLSLFFIDEVKKYRLEDGEPGLYARMFEEAYAELIVRPKYEKLRDVFSSDASAVHDGYFSQDRKGQYKNTRGDTLDDYSTYNTIMRDKEWLLSYACPLRFIFSHSALKEGWDNPNVFQVCTLLDQRSVFTCRQKVGRGLRLCVNQDGERIEDRHINILHVMAHESSAEFVDTLQKEIEQETGVQFGVLGIGLFSGMVYEEPVLEEKTITRDEAETVIRQLETQGLLDESGRALPVAGDASAELFAALPEDVAPAAEKILNVLTMSDIRADVREVTGITYTATVQKEKVVSYDDARELLDHFEEKGYISGSGRIKDTMKEALQSGTLDLPRKFEAARNVFETIIYKADRRLPVADASHDIVVRRRDDMLKSPFFHMLWDKIKQKTAYRVNPDSGEVVRRCIKEIRNMPSIAGARIITQTDDVHIDHAGVSSTERDLRIMDLKGEPHPLPDVLPVLQEECGVPPAMGRDILTESGRLRDFARNPQLFMEQAIPLIKNVVKEMEIEGIFYMAREGEAYSAEEVFDREEILASLDKNAVEVEHTIYDHVIYDSKTVEKPFARALDEDPDVRMYFKIPAKYKIETPLGRYTPDWAVCLEREDGELMYLVLETKGSTSRMDLRPTEDLRYFCGERHFQALGNGVIMKKAADWKECKRGL